MIGYRTVLVVLAAVAGCAVSGCTLILEPGQRDAGPRPDSSTDADDIDADRPDDGDVEGDADADVIFCDTYETSCVGDHLFQCADGGWVEAELCALGCSAELDRCLRLVASNVPEHDIEEATVDVHIASAVTVDTESCDGTEFDEPVPARTAVSAGDGPGLCILTVASLTIDITGALRAEGPLALVLLVVGDVVVDGVIDVSASRSRPGPGGGASGAGLGDSAGTCGAKAGTVTTGNLALSGGGGGGHGGVGGQGGRALTSAGGFGGVPWGDSDLVPLTGGCGGAGGGFWTDAVGTDARGGGGGGALQISAAGNIYVNGTIVAAGGGGTGAQRFGGCGGGAGGGVLLEAATVAVTGVIAANGGGGASGADIDIAGLSGENGSADGTAAPGGGAVTDEAGAGGQGSARAITNGEPGYEAERAATTWQSGGGGGGGAGRIRINTRDGHVDLGGTLSPDTPETVTTGTVEVR